MGGWGSVVAWSEQDDALLAEKLALGWSSAQIAAQFGNRSRNAVIGRIHRLKLARTVKPKVVRTAAAALNMKSSGKAATNGATHPWNGSKARNAALVAREPVRKEKPNAPAPMMVELEDLGSGQCKWPIGDPLHEDFGFCGNGRQEGKPYCPHHVSRSVSTWVPGMLRGVEA